MVQFQGSRSPVPPIYLRVVQSKDKKHIIREVIDGQQRISAIIDFMAGDFAISKRIDSEASGKRFDDLEEDERDRIRQFSLICEVFHGIEDAEVLQVFARLNTYSVKLNAQELRNGRFFGPFKQTVYGLAFDHLEWWRENRIFTEKKIARMAEVELTSELIVLQLDGLQDKKKSLDDFYEKFDESFPERKKAKTQFRATIDTITEACTGILPESEFRRVPLFYTLFGVVYHRLFGMPSCGLASPKRGRLSVTENDSLRDAVTSLSEIVANARNEEGDVPPTHKRFVDASLRQTDNIKPRSVRLERLYTAAF